jgi:hypothetical protein
MNTIMLGKIKPYYTLIIVFLIELASCSPFGNQTESPAAEAPTSAAIQFFLTADNLPVQVTHSDGSTTDLTQGQTVPVSINDDIKVDGAGLGKLLYSDRVNVEILQNTELTLSNLTEVTGGRIEATFNLLSGHTHVRTGENGKADVILKTDDATITTLVDDTDFTVCYAPGADGLTCHPVIRGSIKVFGKTGTQVYDGPSGGYTFNGQAPQPPVCFHEQEYKDWLTQMRSGQNVEPLGAIVARWYENSCPDVNAAQVSMETPAPMVMETSTPMAMESSYYFTEEFNADTDLGKWPSFQWNNTGSDNFLSQDVTPTAQDGYLVFNIRKPYISTFVSYNPVDYDNVKVSISAHNGGQNTNSVSLICRYSHEGWYEFRIGNDGLYSILAFMAVERHYYNLQSGGSTAILSGMGVNEYSATCNANELSLSINGTKVASIKDNMHQLGTGKVGFAVSSYDILPILIEINWFKIEKP